MKLEKLLDFDPERTERTTDSKLGRCAKLRHGRRNDFFVCVGSIKEFVD